MDPQLAALVDNDTPKLNPILANGLASIHMLKVEEYIDQVITLTAKGFPPGLEYHGYKRCTPQEEFRERTRRRDNRQVFDIAESHIYMVKYLFTYMGEELPEMFLYLPYVNDGGTIKLGGSLFTISPVLADRVISVGISNVFIRLLRGKVTFMRTPHQIYVDDKRETIQVTHGLIYNKNDRQKRFETTIKINSVLPHYLFCKFGVKETFKKYGNTDIVIGSSEIDTQSYPPEEWVICESMYEKLPVKPKALGRFAYQPTNIRVAIRRKDFTPLVRQLVGGFYYVVDHFPDRLTLEHIEATNFWKIMLGNILISGRVNAGILFNDMDEHINSLDEYIDIPVAVNLRDIGIHINDFYDLMVVVMDKFSDWTLEAGDNINSLYNKELSILYYVMYEITSAIFKLYFKLKAGSNKVMNVKEVVNIFKTHLRTGLIFSITKMHGEISASSYSGDNKALKFTSIMVPQQDTNRLKSRKGRTAIEDPTKRLHVSVAEVGGYSNIPKSEPSGRSRLNLFVGVDSKNVVKRNPQLVPLLDHVEQMLK